MFLRDAWAVALLLGLTGCEPYAGSTSTWCLEQSNNSPDCCPARWHLDSRYPICCLDGKHAVSDFAHPDWIICIFDADAGIDAQADAGADAEADAGTDAP
jgi:hypothetical protein